MALRGTPPRLWGKRFRRLDILNSHAVHPHACGENGAPSTGVMTQNGTPPRLWGKRHLSQTIFPDTRYTPTPVGKTNGSVRARFADAVHPHACGENSVTIMEDILQSGTPPRLWGKPGRPVAAAREARYTPTPVGKTACRSGGSQLCAVHPHACGENPSRPL